VEELEGAFILALFDVRHNVQEREDPRTCGGAWGPK